MTKIITWMKKHRKISTMILCLILLIGYLGYQKFRPKTPQELYQFGVVKNSSLTQTITASGRIKSKTQVNLQFQTSGQLAWVGVKEGDKVKKWQAIAGLDQQQLKKSLQKYLLDFSKERNDFDEDIKVTYRDKALTDTISRILQKNQYDLAKSVLDVELQDLTLKYATLTSPINGIITHIDTPVPGVNITPSTAIFTVADPDQLIFEAEIDETDIGKIKLGQTAKLTLDAYPNEPINLTVDAIDFQSTTDAAGSTIYLVKFTIFNNSANQIYRLGMNGEVIIITSQKDNVLTLPIEAVLNNQVQLIEGNQAVKTNVTTGIESDTEIEIVSGLLSGQQVVVGTKTK